MTDETKDVVPAEGGEPTKPTADTSPKSGDQGSDGSASELEVLSKQIADLTGIVRSLQSDKDKGVAKVQKDVKEMQEELDRYEQYFQYRQSGLDERKAKREMVLDELAETYDVPRQDAPAVRPVQASDESLKPALALAGLDANDPDVVRILRETPQPEQMTKIMLLGLERKQAQTKTASAGAAMSTGGGTAVASESLETVEAQLTAALNEPIKDQKKIRELRVKHEELLKQQ